MALDWNETLAYLAGILDGEGSISYYRRRGRRGRDLRVCISMTDPEAIDLFAKTFGGGIVHYDIPKGGHKGVYRWAASSGRAEQVLNMLSPYLQVKRKLADIVLCARNLGSFHRWTDDDVIERRESLIRGVVA